MPPHARVAISKLRLLLGLERRGTTSSSPGSPSNNTKSAPGLGVRIETAAGTIVARLTVSTTTTVKDVKTRVAAVAPQFSGLALQLLVSGFESHGVLQDSSILRDSVTNVLQNSNGELMQQNEICLCIAVRALIRWSVSRSDRGLDISEDGCRLARGGSYGGKYGIGTTRLTKPGHFFTVQINKLPKDKDRVGIGVLCENFLPQRISAGCVPRPPIKGGGALRLYCTGDRCGLRSFGFETTPPPMRGWETGDRITIRFDKHHITNWAMVISLNGKKVREVLDPGRDPPFLPLCSVSHGCCLEIVDGFGEPLEELE